LIFIEKIKRLNSEKLKKLKRVRFVPQGVARQKTLDGNLTWKSEKDEHIIPIIPVPKPRMTRFDCWKPAAIRYFRYADKLRSLAPSIQWDPLNIRFIIPMPKSWPQWKKESLDGKPHARVPDLDNLVKAFKDALLDDDSAVWSYGTILKVWGYSPGIAVTLKPGGDGVPT